MASSLKLFDVVMEIIYVMSGFVMVIGIAIKEMMKILVAKE